MQQLEDPSNYGLENTENFQIPVNDLEGEFIGAWFSRPSNYELGECSATNQVEGDTDEICSGSPLPSIVGKDEITVIYLHGNAETRSQQHRTELYKILQTLGYHVLAIDYRAYADSSFCWTPNESSLSHDALSAYTWLKERSHPESKVVVWGHSLGSGVTAKLGSVLSTSGQISKPDAYILESPFSSLKDEIESFYMSRLLPFDIADQAPRLQNVLRLLFHPSPSY
jgi:abhydrolase domain-containing protein 12